MLNFKNRTKRGRPLSMTIDSETKSGPIAVVGTVKKIGQQSQSSKWLRPQCTVAESNTIRSFLFAFQGNLMVE